MNDLFYWTSAALTVYAMRLHEGIEDEGGLETVEVIALVGVMVALLVAIMKVFQRDSSVGDAALAKLVQWIGSLGTSA
jgi:hypothetical protein